MMNNKVITDISQYTQGFQYDTQKRQLAASQKEELKFFDFKNIPLNLNINLQENSNPIQLYNTENIIFNNITLYSNAKLYNQSSSYLEFKQINLNEFNLELNKVNLKCFKSQNGNLKIENSYFTDTINLETSNKIEIIHCNNDSTTKSKYQLTNIKETLIINSTFSDILISFVSNGKMLLKNNKLINNIINLDTIDEINLSDNIIHNTQITLQSIVNNIKLCNNTFLSTSIAFSNQKTTISYDNIKNLNFILSKQNTLFINEIDFNVTNAFANKLDFLTFYLQESNTYLIFDKAQTLTNTSILFNNTDNTLSFYNINKIDIMTITKNLQNHISFYNYNESLNNSNLTINFNNQNNINIFSFCGYEKVFLNDITEITIDHTLDYLAPKIISFNTKLNDLILRNINTEIQSDKQEITHCSLLKSTIQVINTIIHNLDFHEQSYINMNKLPDYLNINIYANCDSNKNLICCDIIKHSILNVNILNSNLDNINLLQYKTISDKLIIKLDEEKYHYITQGHDNGTKQIVIKQNMEERFIEIESHNSADSSNINEYMYLYDENDKCKINKNNSDTFSFNPFTPSPDKNGQRDFTPNTNLNAQLLSIPTNQHIPFSFNPIDHTDEYQNDGLDQTILLSEESYNSDDNRTYQDYDYNFDISIIEHDQDRYLNQDLNQVNAHNLNQATNHTQTKMPNGSESNINKYNMLTYQHQVQKFSLNIISNNFQDIQGNINFHNPYTNIMLCTNELFTTNRFLFNGDIFIPITNAIILNIGGLNDFTEDYHIKINIELTAIKYLDRITCGMLYSSNTDLSSNNCINVLIKFNPKIHIFDTCVQIGLFCSRPVIKFEINIMRYKRFQINISYLLSYDVSQIVNQPNILFYYV